MGEDILYAEINKIRPISDLLAHARSDSTFHSDRRIALYQTVERLAVTPDRNELYLSGNLQVAEETVRLINTRLPHINENFILLDKAIDQIIKRLPPHQMHIRSSSEIELAAAETAAKCAWRYKKNPGKVIEPLQELLQSPPALSVEGAMRFADAAATLLVCLSPFGEIADLNFVMAESLLENEQVPAGNRVKRIATIFDRAVDFSQKDRIGLTKMFIEGIDEMARSDFSGAHKCLVAQRRKFEQSNRPELVLDVIVPAEISLEMKRQKSLIGPKQQLSIENALSFALTRVASQADIAFG